MTTSNPRKTPYTGDQAWHGPNPDDKLIPNLTGHYQSIVGELRYVADCTRPDITFAVNRLAAAIHNLTRRHWIHMKEMVQYLKATMYHGLCTKATKRSLSTFSDAYFANEVGHRKSTSGIIHRYGDSVIAWASSKQSMQTLSTC